MWVKLVIGAALGLIVGHWVAPGYAAWVLLGMALGALTDIVINRMRRKKCQMP
ncbi:MAG: hypothetical protein WAP20_05255 [Limnochordia bacterium]|jgi:hypothetical protein|nr:hypothetical protein [Bacillota bacterium]HOB08084.1 hypothetical protein [Limnochordia bacterium]NLH32279.1 hypothetical protein [Bacillota bacterium]HPT92443.1 hypothetical protein [Limnochordia bacterium]HPZ30221.1 hypothetical protein [Limnochordia bacterium]